jgi:hypothetical protein
MNYYYYYSYSQDSSIGVEMGYGLDDLAYIVQRVKIRSGAHPASYPAGTDDCSPGVKQPGA